MKDANKVKQGKTNRAQGKSFENRVRADLESKGWIVDRWNNNVDLDTNKKAEEFRIKKLVPAKAKWNNFTKSLMMGSGGFPDFIAMRPHIIEEGKTSLFIHQVIAIECKMNGKLDKEEKEKCIWLLENKIFTKIFIASKHKIKNKIVIKYEDFKC